MSKWTSSPRVQKCTSTPGRPQNARREPPTKHPTRDNPHSSFMARAVVEHATTVIRIEAVSHARLFLANFFLLFCPVPIVHAFPPLLSPASPKRQTSRRRGGTDRHLLLRAIARNDTRMTKIKDRTVYKSFKAVREPKGG